MARVWEVPTGRLIAKWTSDASFIRADFSPDGAKSLMAEIAFEEAGSSTTLTHLVT